MLKKQQPRFMLLLVNIGRLCRVSAYFLRLRAVGAPKNPVRLRPIRGQEHLDRGIDVGFDLGLVRLRSRIQ